MSYIYFDINGRLREYVTTPKRKGSENVDTLFVYWEGNDGTVVLPSQCFIEYGHESIHAGPLTANKISRTIIPFQRERDLRFFQYGKTYQFMCFDLPTAVSSTSGFWHCSVSIHDRLSNNVVQVLGDITFEIEESSIVPSGNLDLSQYNYILDNIKDIEGNLDSKLDKTTPTSIIDGDGNKIVDFASDKVTIHKKAQSIETPVEAKDIVNKEYVDSNIYNSIPKGTYDTLQDLNTAFPTGTSGVYIIRENNHWYYWNGSVWTDGGELYLSQSSDEAFSESSIYPVQNRIIKSNFYLDDTKTTDIEILTGNWVDKNSGVLTQYPTAHYTDFINCFESDTFQITAQCFFNTCIIATYDNKKNFLRSYYGGGNEVQTTTIASWTPKSDEFFVRFSSYPENFSVLKRTTKKSLKEEIGDISTELWNPKTYFSDATFNPATTTGGFINKNDGNVVNVGSGLGIYTDFVAINTNDRFKITAKAKQATCIVAVYDSEKHFIRSYGFDVEWSSQVWTPQADEKYARFCSYDSSESTTIYLLRDYKPTPDEFIGYVLDIPNSDYVWTPTEQIDLDISNILNIRNDGYINKANGNVDPVPNYGYYTDYIPTKTTDTFSVSGKTIANTCLVATYDSHKNFLRSYYGGGSASTEYISQVWTPQADEKFARFCSYPSPSVVVSKKGAPVPNELIDYVKDNIATGHENDVLWGKKYVSCGDSFTQYTATDDGDSSQTGDAWSTKYSNYKTYPYWIAERHNMSWIQLAQSGQSIAVVEGHGSFMSVYQNIPENADYITLQFGLNDQGNCEWGNLENNADTSTEYGAYNVALQWILTNRPKAKVGVIISDGWLNQTWHDNIINVCKYWGIPYLDLKGDPNVPLQTGGRLNNIPVSQTAVDLRNNTFEINTSTDPHPNLTCHKLRSTLVEDFLKKL